MSRACPLVWVTAGTLVVVVYGGCLKPSALLSGPPSDAASPDQRLASAASLVRDMDDLHERLNQHLDQLPPLEAPTDPDNPLVMSPDESRQRLLDAMSQAEEGQISVALESLAKDRCHPDLVGAWNLLWIEFNALRLNQSKVYPLAARFAAAGLQQDPRSGAVEIRRELLGKSAWAWKYEGAVPAVFTARRGDVGAEGGSSESLFLIQGYTNPVEPLLDEVREPHQHFHFAVFRTATQGHIFSYVVQSQDLLGTETVYFLELQASGRPEVLKVYDELPTYSAALEDVKAQLEPPSTSGGPP